MLGWFRPAGQWKTANNFCLESFWKIKTNIIFSMFNRRIVLCLVVLGGIGASLESSPCPIANHNGTVFSGMHPLTKAKSSWAQMPPSCPSSKDKRPNAIITVCPIASSARLKSPSVTHATKTAVHDFEADHSPTLFYYIKPLKSDSLSFVPFAIRTQWLYTRWTKLVFSFLAEDRVDIESNYYQIDSGMLAGCTSGK